jgi:hypothetical protein
VSQPGAVGALQTIDLQNPTGFAATHPHKAASLARGATPASQKWRRLCAALISLRSTRLPDAPFSLAVALSSCAAACFPPSLPRSYAIHPLPVDPRATVLCSHACVHGNLVFTHQATRRLDSHIRRLFDCTVCNSTMHTCVRSARRMRASCACVQSRMHAMVRGAASSRRSECPDGPWTATSIYLYLYLSLYLSIHPSIHPSIHLSIH